MYSFTRIEFSNHRIALLVALTFAVYPILVRNSVSVQAEAPFVVFMLASMVFLSLARKAEGAWHHAMAAGLFLTLAGMLRYEAWMLIPLFALVLWGKWQFAAIFTAASMIFPTVWMAASTIEYGHPLHSMMWSTNWELKHMGRSEKETGELLRQGIYYLLNTARGLTLLIALACVAGASIALVKRHRSAIWIVPLVGLVLLMEFAILRGSLVPKLSYTVTLGTLLIPLSAAFYETIGLGRMSLRRAGTVSALLVFSVILFSCEACWGKFTHPRLFGLSPIPRFENQETVLQVSDAVADHLTSEEEGLILDFFGWGTAAYIALMTRLPADQIYSATGAPNREIDLARVSNIVVRFPSGVLVITEGSRLAGVMEFSANEAVVEGKTLLLEEVASFSLPEDAGRIADVTGPEDRPQVIQVFRYRVANGGG
jgi:hypothetical protein